MIKNFPAGHHPALPPGLRPLGWFTPKAHPQTKILVKVCLDGEPTLWYDRNGSLRGITDPTVRAKIEESLNLLEQQTLLDALKTHQTAGVIHVSDHEMLATVIYRGRLVDLAPYGIKVPQPVWARAAQKLAEWQHPVQRVILGTNQLTNAR